MGGWRISAEFLDNPRNGLTLARYRVVDYNAPSLPLSGIRNLLITNRTDSSKPEDADCRSNLNSPAPKLVQWVPVWPNGKGSLPAHSSTAGTDVVTAEFSAALQPPCERAAWMAGGSYPGRLELSNSTKTIRIMIYQQTDGRDGEGARDRIDPDTLP